ncbi:MAG: hypothetical protein N2663_00890 [Chlorobi bacterium]|nr:hypothetical protein [Chlorobiota bacterium]
MFTRVSIAIAFVTLTAISQIPQRTLRPADEAIQQSVVRTEPSYQVSIGAYLAAKVGINTTVARGRKTDINFNTLPDFGVSIFAPFQTGSRIGAGLDLGYATYTYVNKPESNVTDDNTIIERYSYLNLFPHLNLSGVIVGVNLGFSPKGRAETRSGRQVSVVTNGKTELSSDELGTLVEARIGGNFSIWENPIGHLNLYVMAGYVVSGLYTDYQTYIYSRDNYADNNPKPASLALGLAYYFRVPQVK